MRPAIPAFGIATARSVGDEAIRLASAVLDGFARKDDSCEWYLAVRRGPHQLPVTMRTITGQRIATKRVGKMHSIIGTDSLAGKA